MREELVREIVGLAKENSFHVEKEDDKIIIRSEEDSPITLVIKPRGGEVEIGFEARDLVDYIEELRDHGENVEEVIESQIDDLKSIAYKIMSKISKRVKVVNKLRETELDIIEELEE